MTASARHADEATEPRPAAPRFAAPSPVRPPQAQPPNRKPLLPLGHPSPSPVLFFAASHTSMFAVSRSLFLFSVLCSLFLFSVLCSLVFRRLLHMIDHQHLHRSLLPVPASAQADSSAPREMCRPIRGYPLRWCLPASTPSRNQIRPSSPVLSITGRGSVTNPVCAGIDVRQHCQRHIAPAEATRVRRTRRQMRNHAARNRQARKATANRSCLSLGLSGNSVVEQSSLAGCGCSCGPELSRLLRRQCKHRSFPRLPVRRQLEPLRQQALHHQPHLVFGRRPGRARLNIVAGRLSPIRARATRARA